MIHWLGRDNQTHRIPAAHGALSDGMRIPLESSSVDAWGRECSSLPQPSHCVSKTASGSLSPHKQSHIIVLAPRQPGPTGNPAWAGGEIPRVGGAVFLSNPPLATPQPGEQCSPHTPHHAQQGKAEPSPGGCKDEPRSQRGSGEKAGAGCSA